MGGEIDDRLVPGNRLKQGRLVEEVRRDGTSPELSECVRLRWRARHRGDIVSDRPQLRDGTTADHAGSTADKNLHGRRSILRFGHTPGGALDMLGLLPNSCLCVGAINDRL